MLLTCQAYNTALLSFSVRLKAQHASGMIFYMSSMLVMLQYCMVTLLMCHCEDGTAAFQFVQFKAATMGASASAQL